MVDPWNYLQGPDSSGLAFARWKNDLSSKLGSQILDGQKDTFWWWLLLLQALVNGSMDDGDLRKLLEKPGTVKDIGVLPDKARSVRMWGAPG